MPVQTRVYDQRQTGDLNVQVDLKDVRVVALINSELLEDYMVNQIFLNRILFLFIYSCFSVNIFVLSFSLNSLLFLLYNFIIYIFCL